MRESYWPLPRFPDYSCRALFSFGQGLIFFLQHFTPHVLCSPCCCIFLYGARRPVVCPMPSLPVPLFAMDRPRGLPEVDESDDEDEFRDELVDLSDGKHRKMRLPLQIWLKQLLALKLCSLLLQWLRLLLKGLWRNLANCRWYLRKPQGYTYDPSSPLLCGSGQSVSLRRTRLMTSPQPKRKWHRPH